LQGGLGPLLAPLLPPLGVMAVNIVVATMGVLIVLGSEYHACNGNYETKLFGNF